jgi:trigger factor
MQVTETLSDGLKRNFSVVIPAADLERRRSLRLAELGRTLRLPGFRPGKVPVAVVKQRYGTAVAAEVIEQSVSEATEQMLSERGLRAAMQPRVELVKADPALDLEFTVALELLPEIALPEFASLKLTRYKAEPSEEQVDRALGDLANRQRKLLEVPPRPAEKGDFLCIDFIGSIDGAPFAGGSARQVDVEVGGTGFIPGFSEQLAGLAPGESRSIEVRFPDDYGVAELAGKLATFAITAQALKRAEVPPIDEELAKTLGFDGLDDLKAALKGRFQREFDQLSRLRIKRELFDLLAAHVTFAVPEGLVDAEFGQIWQRLEADRKQGRLDAEDAAKDEATLKAEYRAIAERRVRLGLLLAEIGRSNGITVTAEEMKRAMAAEAARYPGQEKQVLEFFRKNPQAAETLRSPIFEEKVVDFVLELAQVSEQMVSPEELARDPAEPVVAEPVAAEPVAGEAAAEGSAA